MTRLFRSVAIGGCVVLAVTTASGTAAVAAVRPHFLGPVGIALGPRGTSTVWISSVGSVDVPARRIDLFNYRTRHIVRQLSVGLHPSGMATSPDRRTLWVANADGSTVSVVDAVRRRVTGTIHVGGSWRGPTDPVAIAATRTRVYAVCGDRRLSVINSRTRKVVRQIRLTAQPDSGIAVSPNGRTAYIPVVPRAGHFAGSVDVVNLVRGTVSRAVSVGVGTPIGVLLGDNGSRLFVITESWILAYRTATMHRVASAQVNGDTDITSISMIHGGNGVWVALRGTADRVAGYTADTLTDVGSETFPASDGIARTLETPDGRYLVVTMESSNQVNVIRAS